MLILGFILFLLVTVVGIISCVTLKRNGKQSRNNSKKASTPVSTLVKQFDKTENPPNTDKALPPLSTVRNPQRSPYLDRRPPAELPSPHQVPSEKYESYDQPNEMEHPYRGLGGKSKTSVRSSEHVYVDLV